jgi:methanogenic corrinoid protein MtbC1
MEMTEEEQEKHKDFIKIMRQTMEEFNRPLERLYNADQTGLFYNKLANQMYVSAARKDYFRVKQMKSKDRVTLMVATLAVGVKIPLFMVGKAKAPECFQLLVNK